MSLARVTSSAPCPICGRPDWCSVSDDGAIAICMRQSSGSIRQTANNGYLHRLREGPGRGPRLYAIADTPGDFSDFAAIRHFCAEEESARIDTLAAELGVSADSLYILHIGWDSFQQCYTFPMRSGRDPNRVTGVCRRFADGSKKLYVGHSPSLYYPSVFLWSQDPAQNALLVCEGASDVAFATDLGFQAVGRFSCSTGAADIIAMVQRLALPKVNVVTDTGNFAERHGSLKLAETIKAATGASVGIVWPPAKDLRTWCPTRRQLQEAIKNSEEV